MKKTFKKIVSMLALSTALLATPIFASEPLNLNIFGESIVLTDAAPYLEKGRTVVPMRLISENLGFDVKWDGGTREFSVKGVDVKDGEIVLIVGKENQSQVAVSKGGTVTKKNIDSFLIRVYNNYIHI